MKHKLDSDWSQQTRALSAYSKLCSQFFNEFDFTNKQFLLLNPGICEDINHVVAQIKMACEGLSCFYITGHGMDQGFMEKLMKCGKEFFNLPMEKKASISLKKSSAYRGYIQQGTLIIKLSDNFSVQTKKLSEHFWFCISNWDECANHYNFWYFTTKCSTMWLHSLG